MICSRPISISVCVASVLAAAQLQAAVIPVTNAGFEDITGETVVGEFTFGALSGWDLYDPGNITSSGDGPQFYVGTLTPTAPTFFTTGAPEGSRVGIAFNREGTGGDGEYGLQQTLSTSLQANTTYTLDVEIGNIASGTAQSNEFFNLDGFPGYRVDILAGGVIVAQDNNALAGTIPEGAFATSSVMFTTGAAPAQLGQALQIRLVNLNIVDASFPAADLEVDFDNVRFDATLAAVPEPGTALFLLTGVTLAVSRRRRSC